jgi:hypothetical protein
VRAIVPENVGIFVEIHCTYRILGFILLKDDEAIVLTQSVRADLPKKHYVPMHKHDFEVVCKTYVCTDIRYLYQYIPNYDHRKL